MPTEAPALSPGEGGVVDSPLCDSQVSVVHPFIVILKFQVLKKTLQAVKDWAGCQEHLVKRAALTQQCLPSVPKHLDSSPLHPGQPPPSPSFSRVEEIREGFTEAVAMSRAFANGIISLQKTVT